MLPAFGGPEMIDVRFEGCRPRPGVLVTQFHLNRYFRAPVCKSVAMMFWYVAPGSVGHKRVVLL